MEFNKRLNNIYNGMVARCHKPANTIYYKYGAKGITVCEEWRNSWHTFRDWALSNGYEDHLTIDRIDGTKGYSPDNCRWLTQKEQVNNISTNIHIEVNGVTRTASQWADETGIPMATIYQRYHTLGWRGERVLEPKRKRTTGKLLIEVDGVSKTLTEWSEHTGIARGALKSRYRRGLRGTELIKRD